MPLIDMRDMLNHAYSNGYAVGGFALESIDFIEPIVAAAETSRSPVILSLTDSPHVHYDFELAMAAAEKAAHRSSVPVAIHFDHGKSLESAVRAINLGCNGVTISASEESFLGNVTQTRQVVEMAHACGVTVEGELINTASMDDEQHGELADDVQSTSVAEAKAYVTRTGVDCLAVSIGMVQNRLRGRSKIDFERLKRINDTVKIPLMIKNDTGLTEDQYRRLIAYGVAKINCCMALTELAGKRSRTSARGGVDAGNHYSSILKDLHQSIHDEVKRYMYLWGSAGRAAEVIVQCDIWRPVEHVIIYNVEHATDTQVENMMARGREVFGKIPGVRRAITGWAMTEKPTYRFCWIVEFVHEKVVANYQNHPEHIAFANGLFNPLAGERVSNDFLSLGEAPLSRVIQEKQRVRA